jgi:hypothetical protein
MTNKNAVSSGRRRFFVSGHWRAARFSAMIGRHATKVHGLFISRSVTQPRLKFKTAPTEETADA